jgi:hypothetical protein
MIARTVARLMFGQRRERRPTPRDVAIGPAKKHITPETLLHLVSGFLFTCRAASHHFTPVHHQYVECEIKFHYLHAAKSKCECPPWQDALAAAAKLVPA